MLNRILAMFHPRPLNPIEIAEAAINAALAEEARARHIRQAGLEAVRKALDTPPS